MNERSTYHGKLAGVVTNNKDPEMRSRVRCKIPDLFTHPESRQVLESDWCEGGGSWGPGLGVFNPPPVGAPVWVTVRYSDDGESWQLIYEPGRPGAGEAGSHAPTLAQGKDDETAGPLRTSAPFKVPSADSKLGVKNGRDAVITEDTIPGIPGTANAGVYPDNKVLKMPGGTTLEFDDSQGVERVFLWHPSGTCLEINGKGVWVQRETKKWEEIADSRTTRVGTDDRLRVDGNLQVGVGKNHVESAKGRRVILAGEVNIQSRLATLMEVGGAFNMKVRGTAIQRFLADHSMSIGGSHQMSWAGRGSYLSGGDFELASLLGAINLSSGLGVNVVSPLGMRVGFSPIPLASEPLFSLVHYAALVTLLEAMITTLAAHMHPLAPIPDPLSGGAPSVAPSPALVGLLAAAQALMPPMATVSLFAE